MDQAAWMDKVQQIIGAARTGDAAEVAALLDEDPALATASNMLGSQPVHAAHFGGHPSVVELLLRRGVARNVFVAAELGMLDHLRAAIENAPELVQAFTPQGSTALHGACYWGQTAAARFLLEHGADANAPSRDSFLQIRPLGCAVATADVPNPSDDEDTVLELVRVLVAHGADVNGRRRDGLTALHSAAYRGHLRVMAYLLEHGADRTLRGYDSRGPHAGQSAADLAAAQHRHEAARLLGH
ncbi:MAG TPA: ankyrin repeat domain-containing protein [Bryobacteraceae bacterium]|nr:ankyrin repeat domain-containing protein [Bryobacteraceae bacterium]